MDDIIELIIYLAIGVIGLLASAYRNKQRRQAQSRRIPREMEAGSMPDVRPDLGPLAEILGIPELAEPVLRPEPVREAPEQSVEEGGLQAEEEGMQFEMTGPATEPPASMIEQEGMEMEKAGYEGMPVFSSTKESILSDTIIDSGIFDMSSIYRPISDSEIKGAEADEEAGQHEKIDWRKAVIYAEILKRREN